MERKKAEGEEGGSSLEEASGLWLVKAQRVVESARLEAEEEEVRRPSVEARREEKGRSEDRSGRAGVSVASVRVKRPLVGVGPSSYEEASWASQRAEAVQAFPFPSPG